MKLPDTEWYWLAQHRRPYADGARGNMFEKFNLKEIAQYEEGIYDLAILHLDQQCFEEMIKTVGKGSVYRDFNNVIKDIPKIVIMHGTPYYPEMFTSDIKNENYRELGYTKDQVGMSSVLIEELKKAIGTNYLICNSEQATKQWGMGDLITHGMDADEWLDLPKEPRVVSMISPGGLDKYYDRAFLLVVKEMLQDKDIYHCHITVDVQFKNFNDYKEFLGRSLVYFNPTKESPMPRARTEAMFSGCCVVTTGNHGAEKFIKDGVNGFIIDRNKPEATANLIADLIADYQGTLKIGQEGKKTALELFSGERYRNDWVSYINNVLKDFNK